MFYTIYKITNQINGKFYIGKHITNDLDDNYMGSGKLIKRSISKYGVENHTKEYLEILDSEAKMNLAEKIYVIIDQQVSYNLCKGGKGGFGFIHQNKLNLTEKHRIAANKNIRNGTSKLKELKCDPIWHERHSNKVKETHYSKKDGYINPFKNRIHTEQTKKKIGFAMSTLQKGTKNSQYGSMWITNGKDNIKIKKDKVIPDNWYKGRTT